MSNPTPWTNVEPGTYTAMIAGRAVLIEKNIETSQWDIVIDGVMLTNRHKAIDAKAHAECYSLRHPKRNIA